MIPNSKYCGQTYWSLPTEKPIQERRNSALDPQCSLSSSSLSASLLFAFSFWCLRLSIGQLSSILWKSPLLAARSAIAVLVWIRTSSDIYTSCDHFQHSRPNFNVHVLLDRSLSIFLLIQWVSLHCCGWMQTELIFSVICQNIENRDSENVPQGPSPIICDVLKVRYLKLKNSDICPKSESESDNPRRVKPLLACPAWCHLTLAIHRIEKGTITESCRTCWPVEPLTGDGLSRLSFNRAARQRQPATCPQQFNFFLYTYLYYLSGVSNHTRQLNWQLELGQLTSQSWLPVPSTPQPTLKVPNFNFHHPSISCTTCRERKSVSGTSDTWGSIAFLGASPVEIPITIKTSWWTGKPDPDQASQSEFLKLV